MTRPLTLPEYRALLADVAGRHGGVLEGGTVRWYAGDGMLLAALGLRLPTDGTETYTAAMRCGWSVNIAAHPTAALLDLDAARDTLLRAIAARDELAGVVVDVSRGAP